MTAILTENPAEVRSKTPAAVVIDDEMLADLGIWLSGLESFLSSGHYALAGAGTRGDFSKEFRLVHSTLQRCALLNARLLSGRAVTIDADGRLGGRVTYRDLNELGSGLRDSTLLGEGLINSSVLQSGEWKAWGNMLTHRFRGIPAFAKIIRVAEQEGEKYLPPLLCDLTRNPSLIENTAELGTILPRFARILKWLSVVGRMLEADEPLKPALLIFSRLNEQIFELTAYINGRLERFPGQEAELFSSLDAASYTASIELKKVYSQELAGLAGVRPSPSIYARIETAHSLLNDGFQQILAGFAALIDPESDIFEIFPNFRMKRERSIVLRSELWETTLIVQEAEKNPEKERIEALHQTLREFSQGSVRYLFYKDTETVERFVDEILVTKDNKDLVPILHRFGAYLETLFGQVCHRAVLENLPFELGERQAEKNKHI